MPTDPAPPTSIAMTTFLPPGHSCMSLDGHFMQDGEMWYDGCRRCFCYEGHEWCSLITCPPLTCRNPVMRPGDCCPTCPGTQHTHTPVSEVHVQIRPKRPNLFISFFSFLFLNVFGKLSWVKCHFSLNFHISESFNCDPVELN